ncbi:hypothetical protein D3C81_1731200 [compost metagenome]
MRSIKGDRNRMNSRIITPAVTPDRRERPPELRLIIVCPIMAQPPMPPNRPETTFDAPRAMHSRFGWPRVSVISSVRLKVSKVSSKPTMAISAAYGKMMCKVAMSSGTVGQCRAGRPPAICARSPRVRVGSCKKWLSTPTPRMATSAGGTAFVMRGST